MSLLTNIRNEILFIQQLIFSNPSVLFLLFPPNPQTSLAFRLRMSRPKACRNAGQSRDVFRRLRNRDVGISRRHSPLDLIIDPGFACICVASLYIARGVLFLKFGPCGLARPQGCGLCGSHGTDSHGCSSVLFNWNDDRPAGRPLFTMPDHVLNCT